MEWNVLAPLQPPEVQFLRPGGPLPNKDPYVFHQVGLGKSFAPSHGENAIIFSEACSGKSRSQSDRVAPIVNV